MILISTMKDNSYTILLPLTIFYYVISINYDYLVRPMSSNEQ